MNIALVDDEMIQLQNLRELLSSELLSLLPDAHHKIDAFRSGQTFLDHWIAGSYDVVVLDIFMGGISGVDVAKEIRRTDSDVKLVFCSRSNEFAAESYQVNAQYYLVKPATPGSIMNMLRRLDLEMIRLGESVTLPDGQKILLRQVLYTVYYNHVVTIHMKNAEICRVRINHSELEALLVPFGYFYSPSKGMLVNFHEVVQSNDDSFILSDGTSVPISRRKSKDTLAAFTKFRFQKMRSEVGV